MRLKKMAAVILSAAILATFPAAGCGNSINTVAVAATLDGKEITMGVANFIAQCQAAQMDSYMLSFYGEKLWSSESSVGDGLTMEESAKKTIMETVREYYLMDAHASEYSIEVTEEDKAAITAAATRFLSENSSDVLKRMSATQETVEEAFRLYKVQSKMRAAIQETIDTNVSDEECAQKTFSYVKFDKSGSTSTDTATDDAQASDPKADAQAFLEAAASDMDAAAKEKEYAVIPCSYNKADLNKDDNTTSMDVAVLEAADKLKEGKVATDLVETDSAYYVVRMDSLDDKEAAERKKETILNERRNDKYSEVVKKYVDGCKWEVNEKEWEKVNFDVLYTIKKAETTTDDAAAAGTGTDDAAAGTGTDDAATSAQ